MYIRELTTLIAVADQGSFLKAAKELYITPASVMNQMNKLEGIVGVKLIERTNQGTTLTAAGRSIYQDAKQMIEFSNAAIEKARQLSTAEQNVIRVGTSILRPCKQLIDLWAEIDDGSQPFQIRIVPFDDEPDSLNAVMSSLGSQIDCFVGPCDSIEWQTRHNILLLDYIPCRIAVPRKHRLAKKKQLTWHDLDGEIFMLIQRGDSPVLNQMRDDILRKLYNQGTTTFNALGNVANRGVYILGCPFTRALICGKIPSMMLQVNNRDLGDKLMSKPSECFKSIGEIRAFVDSMKDTMSADDYELLLYYFGLLENRGLADIVVLQGKEIKIDRYIAPMIADLNQRGIPTLASCSGLREEHPESKFVPEAGYVSLAFNEGLLKHLLTDLTDPLIKVEESECYLERSISVYINSKDDAILKEKWSVVWDSLKRSLRQRT